MAEEAAGLAHPDVDQIHELGVAHAVVLFVLSLPVVAHNVGLALVGKAPHCFCQVVDFLPAYFVVLVQVVDVTSLLYPK